MTPAQRAQVRQLLIEAAQRGGGLNMSLAPDGVGVFHEFLPRGVAPTGPPPRAATPAPPVRTETRAPPSDVLARMGAAVQRGSPATEDGKGPSDAAA